jgi:hypothetical protein
LRHACREPEARELRRSARARSVRDMLRLSPVTLSVATAARDRAGRFLVRARDPCEEAIGECCRVIEAMVPASLAHGRVNGEIGGASVVRDRVRHTIHRTNEALGGGSVPIDRMNEAMHRGSDPMGWSNEATRQGSKSVRLANETHSRARLGPRPHFLLRLDRRGLPARDLTGPWPVWPGRGTPIARR